MRGAAVITCGIFVALMFLGSGGTFAMGSSLGFRDQFQEVKKEYIEKKSKGYDVSGVEPLIKELREAMRSHESSRAKKLLKQIEDRLDNITDKTSGKASTEPSAGVSIPEAITPFAFGYAHPGIADKIAETGINYAKVFAVPWSIMEPSKPVRGKHRYEWKRLDAMVREYHGAGINLQLTINCVSKWATKPIPAKKAGVLIKSNAPKKEHWKDYADFIRNLVERYDHDGKDDMPGLLAPIRYFEIETEAQFGLLWRGTAEEYIKLLRTANKAAKEANPKSRIILSGLNFGDLLDDEPSQQVFEKRIKDLGHFVQVFDFTKKILAAGDAYDIVEFHANRDYGGVYGGAKWIRNELKKNGYEKALWVGDATSAPWLIPTPYDINPIMPLKKAQKLYKELKDQNNPGHTRASAWYRGEQAALTVKKFVVAFDSKIETLIIETLQDPGKVKKGQDVFDGFSTQGILGKGNSPRPVFYTLRLLKKKIGGYSSVKRLTKGDVYVYRFNVKGRIVFVAWAENGKKSVEIKVKNREHTLTEIVKDLGLRTPVSRKIIASNGRLRLQLNTFPVFIDGY